MQSYNHFPITLHFVACSRQGKEGISLPAEMRLFIHFHGKQAILKPTRMLWNIPVDNGAQVVLQIHTI